jgi:hypothetical protein
MVIDRENGKQGRPAEEDGPCFSVSEMGYRAWISRLLKK